MVQVEEYIASLNLTVHITAIDITVVVLCSIVSITTVVGNLLVLCSVLSFYKLRTRNNVLIASLAVADLLVGAIVMPISIIYDVNGEWIFSDVTCTLWISFDVVCTTSSIFHIGCIAVDRYMTIMHPFRYPTFISVVKLTLLSVLLWTLSIVFVILPINLGWNKPPKNIGPDILTKQCFFITNGTYAVITSVCIFYGPSIFMTALYIRIFKVAMQQVKRVRRYPRNRVAPANFITVQSMDYCNTVNSDLDATTRFNRDHSETNTKNSDNVKHISNNHTKKQISSKVRQNQQQNVLIATVENLHSVGHISTFEETGTEYASSYSTSSRPSTTSNYKAAKTLGLIMGCFFVCWFPFFLIYTVHPFMPSFVETKALSKCSIWLGYLNSCMNPIIYSRSKTFRSAFSKIARCRFNECRE